MTPHLGPLLLAWATGPAAPPPPAAPAPAGGPTNTEEVGVVAEQEADPVVFPDPAKFSRGFFAEGSTGALIPIGPTSNVLGAGFSLTARLGYEIRRWVALQATVTGTLSKYDDGVLTDELLQQFFYTGEARFGIPIRRFLIAFQGGAGIYQLTNNLLQLPGIAQSNALIGFVYDGSLAFDVHSLNRHFSGGVVGTYYGMPDLDNSGAMAVQVYLRYTL